MNKNIADITLENLLPENLVNNVMKFHGGVDGWLPDKAIERVPEKVKDLMRKGNFEFGVKNINTYKPSRRLIRKHDEIYLQINVNKSIIRNIIDKMVRVEFCYDPEETALMGVQCITGIRGDFICTERYDNLHLDNFEYLTITVVYDEVEWKI